MQVNLAGALGLLGLKPQPVEGAKVAADFTTEEEVQAKWMPPTPASIAIDEAIVEAMEWPEAQKLAPDPPPKLQPNTSLFGAQDQQPTADSKKLDEERTYSRGDLLPFDSQTNSAESPPVLRPFPIVSAFLPVKSDSAPKADVSGKFETKPDSPVICFVRPDIADLAGASQGAKSEAKRNAGDSASPKPEARQDAPMAPPLRPGLPPHTIALYSGEYKPFNIVTEDGDTFALEWPMPWVPANPTDSVQNETAARPQPSADIAPEAPAPGLKPRPELSAVDRVGGRIKLLDRLERMLARIAPELRDKIIALREVAIKAATIHRPQTTDRPNDPRWPVGSSPNVARDSQPVLEAVSAVKQEVWRLLAEAATQGRPGKMDASPISVGSRTEFARSVIGRVSQFFVSPLRDHIVRDLLPREESPVVHVTEPEPTPVAPTNSGSLEHATALPARELAQKAAPSVVAAVINRIEQMLDDRRGHTVTIRLDPPELGTIDLTVKTVNGRVDTQIIVSNTDVRQFVEANRELLAQALANRGLELGSMSVGAQAHGNGQAQTSAKPFAPAWRPEVQSATTLTTRWSTATALDFSA